MGCNAENACVNGVWQLGISFKNINVIRLGYDTSFDQFSYMYSHMFKLDHYYPKKTNQIVRVYHYNIWICPIQYQLLHMLLQYNIAKTLGQNPDFTFLWCSALIWFLHLSEVIKFFEFSFQFLFSLLLNFVRLAMHICVSIQHWKGDKNGLTDTQTNG